jgi:hypothetical protein
MKIGRKTQLLGENLPQCHFVHRKSHMNWLGNELGRQRNVSVYKQFHVFHDVSREVGADASHTSLYT